MSSRLPPGALTPARTRVLLALLRVYARDGRATVRTVAAEAGVAFNTLWWHLQRLRNAGLVAWEPGTNGTLRPLVAAVPFGDTPAGRQALEEIT